MKIWSDLYFTWDLFNIGLWREFHVQEIKISLKYEKKWASKSWHIRFSPRQFKQESLSHRYQLVVQTTTEERRKVGNNLQRLLEMVAIHVGSVEVSVWSLSYNLRKLFQTLIYFCFASIEIKWSFLFLWRIWSSKNLSEESYIAVCVL